MSYQLPAGVNTWKWPLPPGPSPASGLSLPPPPDPQRLFLFLPPQVGFEDVIAEPVSAHSFDRVWIGSHAAFELVKFLFYRLLSTLLAVPLAFVLGLLFGLLSCIHIW